MFDAAVAETQDPVGHGRDGGVVGDEENGGGLVAGGVVEHLEHLAAGVDVVLACPGRLEDLIAQGHVGLDAVEVTVLDEADHMADLGFLPAVRRLLDRTPRDGQRLLFSATLDAGVDVLVRRYLTSPTTHQADSAQSPVAEIISIGRGAMVAAISTLVVSRRSDGGFSHKQPPCMCSEIMFTGTATLTRSSTAASRNVCVPPPDSPVTARASRCT